LSDEVTVLIRNKIGSFDRRLVSLTPSNVTSDEVQRTVPSTSFPRRPKSPTTTSSGRNCD